MKFELEAINLTEGIKVDEWMGGHIHHTLQFIINHPALFPSRELPDLSAETFVKTRYHVIFQGAPLT